MPISCRERMRAFATPCKRVQLHANSMPNDFGEEQKKAQPVGWAFLKNQRKLLILLFGGNGGIRTLDEALHPILP